MKFAKELSAKAIPEWRAHYFDYKAAKKKIKAAVRAAQKAPRAHSTGLQDVQERANLDTERSPLQHIQPPAPPQRPRFSSYGSIIGSPPKSPPSASPLHLPRPAIPSLPRAAEDADTDHVLPMSLEDVEQAREVAETRRNDFLQFLDSEREKIEAFYRTREDEAKLQLEDLRKQLHFMREQHPRVDSHGGGALRRLGGWAPTNAQRDYSRPEHVPYRVAKRLMKQALGEYYRGLELTKSYALVNREAFRKALKKYNKNMVAVHGPTTDYMNDKVKRARFVDSQEIDQLLSEAEDLYARYFESGNRKVAVGKLRSKAEREDYSGPSARACGLLAAATVLAIQGLVSGAQELDSAYGTKASYLLQLYGGQCLVLVMAYLFSFAIFVFSKAKINYPFIFELDKSTALSWQQFAEIPSYFFFLLGLTMYLNFTVKAGGLLMYVYWPIIPVSLMVLLLLFAPWPYLKARIWFVKTLARLSLSGISRVGFGEFFMGDVLCSLTYSMGNIELFFCLYARSWADPQKCNSSNSRLLGFLSALPGALRALQTLRRANLPWSKEWKPFPHIYNFVKYCLTMGQYITLSIWRIDRTTTNFTAFIVLASLNTIYCLVWDVLLDWSLGDVKHLRRGFRRILIFKHRWIYLAAIILDAAGRANWIFYAIFAKDAQHSSLVSFLVALSEVMRRGMWIVFRIENEHVSHIQENLAFKVGALPYDLSRRDDEDVTTDANVDGAAKSSHLERQSPRASTLERVGSAMRAAHTQDYVRRKPETWEEDDSDDDE